MEVFRILLATLLVLGCESTRLCVGVGTDIESGQTVNTISRGNVSVTGTIPLASSGEWGPLCNLKGVPGRSRLDTTCTNLEVTLGVPNCPLSTRPASYHKFTDYSMSKCYPLHSSSMIEVQRALAEHERAVAIDLFTAASDYGPYTSGTTGSCQEGGTDSFYKTMFWLVPTTKGSVIPMREKSITNNYGCDSLIVIWGMLTCGGAADFGNIYGSNEDTCTVMGPGGIQRISNDQSANNPIVYGNPAAQACRIKQAFTVLKRGETMNMRYGLGFMAPRVAWCANNKIPHFESSKTLDQTCDSQCVSPLGSYLGNKSLTLETHERYGDCPVKVKKQLHVLNGTLVQKSLSTKGLFMAIAGFLEGGWQGMKDGWYGTHSTDAIGNGVAADQASTQEAINSVVASVNHINSVVNSKFASQLSIDHAFNAKFDLLNKRIDDVAAEAAEDQLELMVAMENERILNEHDQRVIGLKNKLIMQLGDNAIQLGGNCLEIKHKCNETCVEELHKGIYLPEKYKDIPAINGTFEIAGIALKINPGWQDPLLITTSVVVALMLAAGIAALVILKAGAGGMPCIP